MSSVVTEEVRNAIRQEWVELATASYDAMMGVSQGLLASGYDLLITYFENIAQDEESAKAFYKLQDDFNMKLRDILNDTLERKFRQNSTND